MKSSITFSWHFDINSGEITGIGCQDYIDSVMSNKSTLLSKLIIHIILE